MRKVLFSWAIAVMLIMSAYVGMSAPKIAQAADSRAACYLDVISAADDLFLSCMLNGEENCVQRHDDLVDIGFWLCDLLYPV